NKMGNKPILGRIDSVVRIIPFSPSALYQSFLNPNSLVEWMPPEGMSAKVDRFSPEVGGGYQMVLTYEQADSISGKTSDNTDEIEAKFLELIPNKKIVSSGVFDSDDSIYSGEMLMTWYFEEIDEGTKVTVVAENVPRGIKKEEHL